jgi:hypothetical protein
MPVSVTCLFVGIALLVFQPLARRAWHADAEHSRHQRPPVSIALYSGGLLDWDIPSPDKLGLASSGMFGLFRKSLERFVSSRGGSVVEADSLTGDLLSSVGLVIFINPTRRLSVSESERLRAFVYRGGGLLVLGDHTDIGGTLAPLNSVLGATAISFNFDSAISLRKGWVGCLDIKRHPVTEGVRDEVDIQIGIGASLEIKRPAFPLVVGRFAYSDVGDYENDGRGGNMGNCRRDPGERLGGRVLIAGEEVGNGRVLVFGDTSPFQNGARFLSQRLVANSVNWLCGTDVAYSGEPVPHLRPFDDVAVIDFTLNPQVSRALFTRKSIGGLANCLHRAGITPVPVRGRLVANAELTLLIAPTRSLEPDFIGDVMRYLRSGGRLVLAKGYTSPEPCAGLLGRLGFEILPVPLGNGEAKGPVRHKNAWAILYDGLPDTLTHASAFGHPTIVTRPVGHGTFTLISDGRFLLDANLESETGCVPENVGFLTALFDDLRKDKRDLVSSDGVLAWDHSH